ncbi:MAG TPA: hypothetical protein VKY85_15770 [Candidatus Angelobacter sp.]|nr:hypothetical protein [Candidatus Angelobacter sp.]
MTHLETNRVLGRRGARELTIPETEFVGGAFNTLVCTLAFDVKTQTHTGGDGDGCSDTDSDNS